MEQQKLTPQKKLELGVAYCIAIKKYLTETNTQIVFVKANGQLTVGPFHQQLEWSDGDIIAAVESIRRSLLKSTSNGDRVYDGLQLFCGNEE